MIPATIDTTTRSYAEREVFDRLRDDATTRTWIVLHSLGIANHPTRAEGEADFVVLAPGLGVLVLEVKGASDATLRRDDSGAWYYSKIGKPDTRGPFRQAREAMHALRNRTANTPASQGVHFLSGVIFPYSRFNVRSPEWHDWEYINSEQFRSRPIGELIKTMFRQGRDHLGSVDHAPYLRHNAPSPEQCEILLQILRPSFDIPIDYGTQKKRNRDETLQFTREQFSALDAMNSNPRVFFSGPAGTGKTFLAIEAAKRAAIEGKKVLLVCFNRQLGNWIKEQVQNLEFPVEATTIHAHMRHIVGRVNIPNENQLAFWNQELPDLACECLLEKFDTNPYEYQYDVLIIDEAQDILHEGFLDFLDLSLTGGLGTGSWRFFGDFAHQSIYEQDRITMEDFIDRRAPNTPHYQLTTNCRNTPEISQWAEILAQVTPGYSNIRRSSNGFVPTIRFYSKEEEQRSMLIEALAELTRYEYRGADIVVLSPKNNKACIAATVDTSPWRERLAQMDEAGSGNLQYGTIHSFKGLEAEAVIVTDIESIHEKRDKDLLYIALTRPLDQLYVLAHERVREQFLSEMSLN